MTETLQQRVAFQCSHTSTGTFYVTLGNTIWKPVSLLQAHQADPDGNLSFILANES